MRKSPTAGAVPVGAEKGAGGRVVVVEDPIVGVGAGKEFHGVAGLDVGGGGVGEAGQAAGADVNGVGGADVLVEHGHAFAGVVTGDVPDLAAQVHGQAPQIDGHDGPKDHDENGCSRASIRPR